MHTFCQGNNFKNNKKIHELLITKIIIHFFFRKFIETKVYAVYPLLYKKIIRVYCVYGVNSMGTPHFVIRLYILNIIAYIQSEIISKFVFVDISFF